MGEGRRGQRRQQAQRAMGMDGLGRVDGGKKEGLGRFPDGLRDTSFADHQCGSAKKSCFGSASPRGIRHYVRLRIAFPRWNRCASTAARAKTRLGCTGECRHVVEDICSRSRAGPLANSRHPVATAAERDWPTLSMYMSSDRDPSGTQRFAARSSIVLRGMGQWWRSGRKIQGFRDRGERAASGCATLWRAGGARSRVQPGRTPPARSEVATRLGAGTRDRR